MRPFTKSLIAGLSVGFILTAAGCPPEHPEAPPEAVKCAVRHPEKRELTDYEQFNGQLEPSKVVEVRARVRGHIAKVHFKDGDIVKDGDPLFDLDPQPFQTEIDKQNDRKKIYEAQKVAAEKEEARLKDLLKKGGASQSQVDKAEADAKALVSQIAATANDVRRAELDLEYSQIKAELDDWAAKRGRIGKAELTEGNLVNAGGSDPLLTTIASIHPIRVYFNVDERSLQRYAENQGIATKSLTDLLTRLKDAKAPFTFALDSEKVPTHKGELTFGNNRIDPATGTLQIYGTVDNEDGKFLPGSRVRVRVQIGQPYPALLVPETAILADQDQRYVLIADGKNVVQRRNVTLGALTDDGLRAIKPADQLAAGEKPEDWWVLVDNLQRARINYPVDPQKPGASATADKPSP
jgi:RND family efflux transporter MFP subunit